MPYYGVHEAWIVGAVRTPIGRYGGALSAVGIFFHDSEGNLLALGQAVG